MKLSERLQNFPLKYRGSRTDKLYNFLNKTFRRKFIEIKSRCTVISLRVSKALLGDTVERESFTFTVTPTDGLAFMAIVFPVTASVNTNLCDMLHQTYN